MDSFSEILRQLGLYKVKYSIEGNSVKIINSAFSEVSRRTANFKLTYIVYFMCPVNFKLQNHNMHKVEKPAQIEGLNTGIKSIFTYHCRHV